MLKEFLPVADAEGAALVDPLFGTIIASFSEFTATNVHEIGVAACQLIQEAGAGLAVAIGPTGRPVAACTASDPDRQPYAAVVWRHPSQPSWTAGVHPTLVALLNIVALLSNQLGDQAEAGSVPPVIDAADSSAGKAFLAAVDRQIWRLERDGLPGTLLMIDIDRLKEVNETLGRRAGDEVLNALISALHDVFRPTDLIARIGGGRFVVWMTTADHLTAAERAEAIRCMPLKATDEAAAMNRTVSMGIATRSPGTHESASDLLERCLSALQAVKAKGGANWRVSPGPMPAPC